MFESVQCLWSLMSALSDDLRRWNSVMNVTVQVVGIIINNVI
jgi:hypothetical protein